MEWIFFNFITYFFQCFTHRYLGWKINVHDSCDISEASSAASIKHEIYVEPAKNHQEAIQHDLEYGASIAVPSKVKPTAEFLHQQHAHHSHREYDHSHHLTTNHASKLSVSHHPQLLTNANNDYDRLSSSSSSSSLSSSSSSPSLSPSPSSSSKNLYEIRLRDAPDEETSQQSQQQHRVATTVQTLSHHNSHSQFTEPAQEIPAINQQLSNLVADHQQPSSLINHGTKLPYVATVNSNAQLPSYSRAPHHYANNYHHYVRHQLTPLPHRYHHQPEPQRTQLMIIRRPVTLTRRPMLQTTNVITSALSLPFPLPLPLPLPSPQRPVYMERKKYRPTPVLTTTLKATSEKAASAVNAPHDKFIKIDTKQHPKLEAKVSADVVASDFTEDLTNPTWKVLKPARNTGFDPDSIVIESGFKPIIRNTVDREDFAQKRISSATNAWRDEAYDKSLDYRTIDEFSPVFVPSLPVTTSTNVDGRKRRKKISSSRISSRFDNPDDMEMAADHRLDTYYLPPIANTRAEELPPVPSSGVLITYDGKKLKDSSGLARSLVDIEHRGRDKLTSDILSRTPQFGKFQGDLPPLISAETRRNNTTYGRKYYSSPADLSRDFLPKTRLTLVERSKRSPLENRTMSSVDFQRDNHGFEHGRRWERDRVGAANSGGIRRDFSCIIMMLIMITARLLI